MDYKDQYKTKKNNQIGGDKNKYKTKKNNQMSGDKNKLLFIMFPGNGSTKKVWNNDVTTENGAYKRNNFIKEIKKLGEIYFYEPKYYNILHYNGVEGNDKWYSDDINFTKDDIDIDNICEKIYNDVKDFNGKIVLLGHSIGSYFVYYFSQKYASKCLFGIIIDGMYFFEPPNYNKKYLKYTDKDIDELRKEVLNSNKKSIDELGKVYFSNIVSYEKIIKNFKTFKTPIISFCNFEIDKTTKEDINYYKKANRERINENNYIKKYNKSSKFKIIDFVNKTHFPHLIEESNNIILENIKLMITKYNK